MTANSERIDWCAQYYAQRWTMHTGASHLRGKIDRKPGGETMPRAPSARSAPDMAARCSPAALLLAAQRARTHKYNLRKWASGGGALIHVYKLI
jgi:hypothetical protein